MFVKKTKSHQLPYSRSSSVSSFPLDFVFSDVRGAALESAGRKKYYVSFIYDYSKFTLIYFLKYKSEVFQKFHEFQDMVERSLLCKQTEVVNIKSFIASLIKSSSPTMYHVPIPINKMVPQSVSTVIL